VTDQMSESTEREVETRLRTLRASVVVRQAPGLPDAGAHTQTIRLQPVILGVFVFVLAFAITGLVVFGNNLGGNQVQSQSSSRSTLDSELVQVAKSDTSGFRLKNITEIRWVATNAEATNSLVLTKVPSPLPVYLIEASGLFNPPSSCGEFTEGIASLCPLLKVPHTSSIIYQATSPICTTFTQYNVAVIVVSRSTLNLIGLNLRPNFGDLSSFGAVQIDRLQKGPLFLGGSPPPTSQIPCSGPVKHVNLNKP